MNSDIENRQLHKILALLGLSGIVLLFFDFVDGYGVVEGWNWFGRFMLPVVVFPFIISASYLARLSVGALPRWSNLVGYAAAILVSAIALYSLSMWNDWEDLLFLSVFSIIPAICIYLGNHLGAADASSDGGLIAVQTTYAVHVSFYLLIVGGVADTGYWLAWLVLLVGFVQIAMLLRRKIWVTLFVLPSTAMWVIEYLG